MYTHPTTFLYFLGTADTAVPPKTNNIATYVPRLTLRLHFPWPSFLRDSITRVLTLCHCSFNQSLQIILVSVLQNQTVSACCPFNQSHSKIRMLPTVPLIRVHTKTLNFPIMFFSYRYVSLYIYLCTHRVGW